MADVHNLIALHGRYGARERVEQNDRHLVDLAANVLESESAVGITYSGFCLTSLPHRRIPDNDIWERPGESVSLVVTPGVLRIGSKVQRFGVPFGSRARMILLYLQTQALRTGLPEVELGKNMTSWMRNMKVPLGGKSRDLVREQANRLSACNLTFFYHDAVSRGFEKDSIIKSGFSFANNIGDDDEAQPRLWEDTVRLGDVFFKALMASPVPLMESALREISNKSMALDLYIWLAYLLPSLREDKHVEWSAIYKQFGAGFGVPRQFRPYAVEQIKTAMAVYPDARLSITEDGLILSPSRAPVEAQIHPVVSIEPPVKPKKGRKKNMT